MTKWENDAIQFPRLLAEIRMFGLTDEQVEQVCDSMDINEQELDILFERAEDEWQRIKDRLAFELLDRKNEEEK